MALISVNPATNETITIYSEMNDNEVATVIDQADSAYQQWKNTAYSERSGLMKKAAVILREKADELAELMALEMGKSVREGRAEANKCAWVCDFYADKAEQFLSDIPIITEAATSKVAFRPLGVVLAVMPWNFPFWQVFRFAAPALMAGNVGLLKHASNVCGCALAIEEVFRSAGFPENCFRSLLIGSKKVAAVIENPLVKAVTLTGSTPAGQAVAKTAGAVLKKTVMELGGSDPYIVLADADLEKTVETCVTSRLINAGQSCIAAKRFIVVEEIADKFEALFVEKMKSKTWGDPLVESNDIGPIARVDLREELHDQVVRSVEKGARLRLGGEVPPGAGAFYPPTVLSHVQKGMAVYDEETFGPVAAIIRVNDEEEAIHVANDTEFGLGAAIFTADLAKGEHMATTRLEAGCCFVNDFVKSDPRLPFGGVKTSGYGRELADFGIREFVNIKTVVVK